ncbi:hypothetical protein CYMTET_52005, partial [Cymbomonas tetramitiformis]
YDQHGAPRQQYVEHSALHQQHEQHGARRLQDAQRLDNWETEALAPSDVAAAQTWVDHPGREQRGGQQQESCWWQRPGPVQGVNEQRLEPLQCQPTPAPHELPDVAQHGHDLFCNKLQHSHTSRPLHSRYPTEQPEAPPRYQGPRSRPCTSAFDRPDGGVPCDTRCNPQADHHTWHSEQQPMIHLRPEVDPARQLYADFQNPHHQNVAGNVHDPPSSGHLPQHGGGCDKGRFRQPNTSLLHHADAYDPQDIDGPRRPPLLEFRRDGLHHPPLCQNRANCEDERSDYCTKQPLSFDPPNIEYSYRKSYDAGSTWDEQRHAYHEVHRQYHPRTALSELTGEYEQPPQCASPTMLGGISPTPSILDNWLQRKGIANLHMPTPDSGTDALHPQYPSTDNRVHGVPATRARDCKGRMAEHMSQVGGRTSQAAPPPQQSRKNISRKRKIASVSSKDYDATKSARVGRSKDAMPPLMASMMASPLAPSTHLADDVVMLRKSSTTKARSLAKKAAENLVPQMPPDFEAYAFRGKREVQLKELEWSEPAMTAAQFEGKLTRSDEDNLLRTFDIPLAHR